jgi:hypothetical protein
MGLFQLEIFLYVYLQSIATSERLQIGVARWYIFSPKIGILSTFRRVLQCKMLVYFMDIWSILRPSNILHMGIWYI